MFNYIMTDKSVTYQPKHRALVDWVGGPDGKNTWLRITTYGPSAARSFLHDPEPNIFRTGPTKLGQ